MKKVIRIEEVISGFVYYVGKGFSIDEIDKIDIAESVEDALETNDTVIINDCKEIFRSDDEFQLIVTLVTKEEAIATHPTERVLFIKEDDVVKFISKFEVIFSYMSEPMEQTDYLTIDNFEADYLPTFFVNKDDNYESMIKGLDNVMSMTVSDFNKLLDNNSIDFSELKSIKKEEPK